MTKIEWTDETWNPIVGCSKISEGCKNCYAEKMAHRLACMAIKQSNSEFLTINGIGAYTLVTLDGKWNGQTRLVVSSFQKLLDWKKPRKIFVCSMGDLFHESVPFEWIDKVFALTQKSLQHTFQILTKRPERMLEYFKNRGIINPYLNVWIGVTAENQEQADKRISFLLETPALIKFVSVEPMLGPVDIEKYLVSGASGFPEEMDKYHDWIDWVICGGETGPKARKMDGIWVTYLLQQCENAGIPFFFKKWGNHKSNTINGVKFQQFPIVK